MYDVAVYKHINGDWIRKTTVSEDEFEEMLDSDFVEFVFTFTFDEWAELNYEAERRNMKLGALLDERMEQNQ